MAASTEPSPVQGQPLAKGAAPAGRGRIVVSVLGAVVLLGCVVWGVQWWRTGRFIESTDDAYLKADSVTVAPKVAGYVAEVYVQANQEVKQGQPLVRIDSRQYQAALDQIHATTAARRADLLRAEADLQQEQAQIEQAQAQAQVARLAARHAHEEYARYAPLMATGAATTERVAELRHAQDQADAELVANEAAVKAAQSHLTASRAALAQAQAQITASEAGARQSRLDVDDTVLRSALAGRVGDLSVRVGQYAQPGTRMMTVVPVQQVYLVANFKETQIGHMRVGQPARIHVDALADQVLRGVVESFSPGTGAQFALLPPENATGNFTKIVQRVPVRIRIEAGEAPRRVLLPGLSVTADVDTRASDQDKPPAQPAAASGPDHD